MFARHEKPSFARLDLLIPGSPEVIRSTRELVESLCARLTGDLELGARAALATHELLENIMKYGHEGGGGSLAVVLALEPEETAVAISTSNRACRRDLERVESLILGITGTTSPEAHYERLLSSAVESDEGSGLGLARICAEADMELSASIDADRVTITAHLIRKRTTA